MMKRSILFILIAAILFTVWKGMLPEQTFRGLQEAKVFSETGFEEILCTLDAVAPLPNSYYNAVGREAFLEDLAEDMGIHDGYTLLSSRDGNASRTQLIKNGTHAVTTMNWLALEEEKDGNFLVENYLHITLEIPGNIDSAFYYQELLGGVLAGQGLYTKVNLKLTGSFPGQLSEEDALGVCRRLMEALHAKEQDSRREPDLYVVYGYSSKIKDYLMLGKQKTNVNIAVTYNEKQNTTDVMLGMPVLTGDY